MKLIELEQNTPEWHAFRKAHIGASDVSTILGLNPYKTLHKLWEEKTKEVIEAEEDNEDTRRGKEKEKVARSFYIKLSSTPVVPKVGESEIWPIMSASFDGLSEDFTLNYEAKCPREENYFKAITADIPCYYMAQMQAGLFVNEKAEKCIYHVFWDNKEYFIRSVYPDEDFQRHMLEKCKEFWDMVVNRIEPPKGKKNCAIIEDINLNSKASEWKLLKVSQLQIEEKLKEMEEELKSLSDNKDVFFPTSKVRLTWTDKPGSISYAKLCKELDVSEELKRKYTGKPTRYAKLDY